MMDTTSVWNGQDPNLSVAPHDDFGQFLDMSMNDLSHGMNFDFQDFSGQNNGQILHPEGGEHMDTRMDVDVAILRHKDPMLQSQMPPMTSAPSHSSIIDTPTDRGHSSSDSLVVLDAQIQFLQQQRQRQLQEQQQQQQQQQERQHQQQQQQRNQFYTHTRMIVPPTPNSIEMHSANNQFYPQSDPQQQAMYERYRIKEQDLAFTPLVSPAVTPLEAHFNIPEYTVPGAYFSPLSSPAMHAQNELRSVYDTRRNDPTSVPSPSDMSVDAGPTSASNGNLVKKAAKKAASKPRTPRVRSSPIVKAAQQRRKGNGSAVISPQALADIVEPSTQEPFKKPQESTRSRASTEGSENDSISPEHLSDMAPPPLPTPGSGRSPFLLGKNGQPPAQQMATGNALSPATPASLMRLPKADQTSPAFSNIGDADDHTMDELSLPEPASPAKPRPPRIDTTSDGQVTPTVDSTATPSFQSLPSPAFTRPGGVASASSPQLTSLNNSAAGRKTPQISVRGAKKRSSVGSVQVSPALRPKISPSIKPLIRGSSTVSEDTASYILTSKSNYQNILEGTHLPGVSYPTELSTNLTSKRTSHKIAEQGRRNRINSALQEIATLLPRGCSKDSGNEKGGSGSGDAAEGKGGAGGQSANSKASTVELAIEYIKQLKQEVADANKRAEEAEKALELKVT